MIAVEVAAAQPTEADKAAIAHVSAAARTSLPEVAYLVKVKLESLPPATSMGCALYANDFRISKYCEYEHGIYIKVFDPQSFADHKGQRLRFTSNGTDFIDTGVGPSEPSK